MCYNFEICVRQTGLKSLIAYSSGAHIGILIGGLTIEGIVVLLL